ncbi:MAG: hypothetical protein ACTSRZ_06450 [Promethearchaeota archaeon]
MRSNVKKLLFLLLLCLFPLSSIYLTKQVYADAGDSWSNLTPTPPITSPEGFRMTQYIQFQIQRLDNDNHYNVPIIIHPTFEDYTCNASSLRIVYSNDSDFVELAYQNTSAYNYYPSGYLQDVELTFIMPLVDSPFELFRLYWTYNASGVVDPDYSTDYAEFQAPNSTEFFGEPMSLEVAPTIQFDNAGSNNSYNLLIRKPKGSYSINIISTEFKYLGRPYFTQSPNIQEIDLGAGYQNTPLSIKLVNGATAGWGLATETFLLVGTYNGTLVYKHTAGNNQFNYVTGITYPGNPYCLGIDAGNVIGSDTYEILSGLKNGSTLVYSFDGSTLSFQSNCTIWPKRNKAQKAWGLGLVSVDSSVPNKKSLVMATAHTEASPNYGYFSVFNESTQTPGIMEERPPDDQTTDLTVRYSNTQATDIYGPNMYVANFVDDSISNGDEFLIVGRSLTGDLDVRIGHVDYYDGHNTSHINRRLLSGSDAGFGWNHYVIDSLNASEQLTAADFSTKLNDNSNYSIVTGSSSGKVYWYNISYKDSSSVQLLGGQDYQYDFGYGVGNLLPICGNFDDEDNIYDDVVVASSKGRLYYLRYNPSKGNLEYAGSQLIDPNIDLTGIGKALAKMNIDTSDNKEELFVAGNDGKIRILTTSFPSNIRIDVGEYEAGDPESQFAGDNTYNETICNNFADDINTYITNHPSNTVNILGVEYYKIPINITSATKGFIYLSNLSIEYNTTDYAIAEMPSEIDFPVPFNSISPTPIDNDLDNYPDVYEHFNKTYVAGGGSTIVYLSNDGTPTVLNDGDPLPLAFRGMDPWNDDSDGDGIRDGYEFYGVADPAIGTYIANATNPMSPDSDGDTLTDYQELITYGTLYGAPCVVNIDYDNDGLNDTIEFANNGDPQNADTDSDGLSDSEEYYKYKSNLNAIDSDGDGLTDFQESDKNPTPLGNWVFGSYHTYFWKADGTGLNLSNADSDGDGLSDYDEIMGYVSVDYADQQTPHTYYTYPTSADTDGDLVNDYDEVVGRLIIYIEAELQNGEWTFKKVTNNNFVTNPESADSDSDGLTDYEESSLMTNPGDADTDNDGLSDGEEYHGFKYEQSILKTNATNPDSDGDKLLDGNEVNGIYNGIPYYASTHSDPTKSDTDEDGWDDYYEVAIAFTNPLLADSDGDGLIDPVDPMPMLTNIMTVLAYLLVVVSLVSSIIAYPLNKRAAKVATRAKMEYKKKIKQITDRLERERIEADRVTAFARLMPSDLKSGKLNVKINLRINDPSFLCRQATLFYSATGGFESVVMDKIDDYNFSVVLANIPVDMTVLYYFELLDKSGTTIRVLKNETEQQTYEFSTHKDGITEATDWDTSGLIKCSVCGYMCRPEWDNCPECNTPLHDKMLTQEIFLEDQIKKEEERAKETDLDEIAWKEAQETDEFWKTLPECPSCGYTVQLDWAQCPVCGFDLTTVELKKKAVYDDVEADWDAMMGEEHETLYDDTEKPKSAKETKKEMEKIEKKKKKKEADEWGTEEEEDRDIF